MSATRLFAAPMASLCLGLAVGPVWGGVLTTLDLPAGASASILYDAWIGAPPRFEFAASNEPRSETHETDVLFGWAYGSVRSDNGARLMWCTGVSVLPPDGTQIELFAIAAFEGLDLLILGEIPTEDQLLAGQSVSVLDGLAEGTRLRVKIANDVLDLAQLLDHEFVASLPDYSGEAELQSFGSMRFFDGLVGDFNADGVVDGADFLAWQRGESPLPHSASDLTGWEAGWGSPAVIGLPIPEPSTLYAAVGWAILAMRRQRCALPA